MQSNNYSKQQEKNDKTKLKKFKTRMEIEVQKK